MAQLTILRPDTNSSVEISGTSASASGDTFKNQGRTWLKVKNGGTGDKTVTITPQSSFNDDLQVKEISFTVLENEERMIGPFPTRYFNDSDGEVSVTYSDHSDITVAAIQQKI